MTFSRQSVSSIHRSSPSFTLIELLIVIGILAVLATVVVLVINPAELFKQGRDSTRVADLKALNTALSLAELEGLSLGTATKVYVSIADSDSGCANLGLPSLPAGYTYNCVTSANLQKVDGTGWIPVVFTSIVQGSPLARLPVDPVSTTSTGNYYTYIPGGSWQVNARLESEKFAQSAAKDGGADPATLETGSNLSLANFTHGMVGFWTFESGNNSTAADSSGFGFTGTWNGTSSNHYTTGRVGTYAGTFNGSSDYLTLTDPPQTQQMSYVFWNKPNSTGNRTVISHLRMISRSTTGALTMENLGVSAVSYSRSNSDAWEHVVITNDTLSALQAKFYINGQLVSTQATTHGNAVNGTQIGAYVGGQFFSGSIDNLRIYRRILTAAEVAALYAAEN